MSYDWSFKSWDELSKDDLYAVLALRSEVFIIEQDCPYQDVDGKDQKSHHVICKNSVGEVVAYTRIPKPDVSYTNTPSIGRVVTKETERGTGLGHILMKKSVKFLEELYGEDSDILISAQSHLEGFYGSHGFKKTGKEYLEDGIPHVEMIRRV